MEYSLDAAVHVFRGRILILLFQVLCFSDIRITRRISGTKLCGIMNRNLEV